MNTNTYTTMAFALVTALSLASCPAAKPTAAEPEASAPRAPRAASVAFVSGDATIDGRPVEPGDALALRFVARTGKDSRVDIVFGDRNVISVSQNSLAEIDLASLAPSIRLERGGLSSVLKKLEKVASGDSFNVQTAQAVMGVRGTSFCVWADGSSTYVCACNGEVHTADSKGSHEESLASSHHVARVYSIKDDGIAVEAAGMLHHSDESIQSVASRIGYVIDWTAIDR